jgi:hypothetical protein
MQWEGNPNVQGAGQIRPAYRTYLEQFAGRYDAPSVDADGYIAWWRPENKHGAYIIDSRRADPAIPLVMASFAHFLGDTWNLTRIIPEGPFGPKELNGLLLSPAFWEERDEEHILIFQRDTVCLQPLDPKFLDYDMIGAPCGQIGRDGRGEILTFDMNGGLSLRRRSAMLKALSHTPVPDGMPEDVYFTRVLRKLCHTLDARMPDLETAGAFALENERFYKGLPFGVHGTDKHYHSEALAKAMLAQVELRELSGGKVCS